MGVDEFYKFIEDGFLNKSLFVDGGWDIFKVDGVFYGFPEVADKFHVDIGFEKGGADLFDHIIEGLDGC